MLARSRFTRYRRLTWLTFVGLIISVLVPSAGAQSDAAYGVKPLHRFTFNRVTRAETACVDALNPSVTLSYNAQEPLEVVAGRTAGDRAVRLDRGFYEMAAPAIEAKDGVTFELWFRRLGPGSLQGNNTPNGMLFAIGDGYWSGLRCYLDAGVSRPLFQIGRPQPSSAVTATGSTAVLDGVWNHLVTTWDGRIMRVYVNGFPVAEQAYDGAYTSPTQGRLRLGYAGAGVGSVRMDVDSLTIHRGAMSGSHVLRRAADDAPIDEAAAARFQAALVALQGGDARAAREAIAPLLDDDSMLDPAYVPLAKLLLGDALGRLGDARTAQAAYVDAFHRTNSPTWQGAAAQRLLSGVIVADDATVAVYEYLHQKGTGPKKQVGLLLAESYVRLERWDDAVRLYDEILADASLPPLERVDVQSQRLEALDCRARALNLSDPRVAAARQALAESADFRDYQNVLRDGFTTTIDRADLLDPETALPTTATALYVASDGDDANAGTVEKPLATLQGARDAARRLRRDGKLPEGGVTIWIRGGIYSVEATLELSEEDSGTADGPVLYRAFPGERPIFRGGVDVTHFMPVTDAAILARLPEAARGHVVQADLRAAGIQDFGSLNNRGMGRASYPVKPWPDLFAEGRALTLARWPNEGEPEVQVAAVHSGAMGTPEAGKPGEFSFSDARMSRWSTAPDAWLDGKWGHLWSSQKVPVERIDAAAGRIRIGAGSGYGLRAGDPFHVLNLLEELDTPGEWYLDRTTGHVYLWPPADLTPLKVSFPVLEKPFVVMRSAAWVVLEGLTFELSRVDAVSMQNCQDCALAGCTVREIGGNALSIEGGEHCGAAGCDFICLGAGGVRLRGGNRATLRPGRHYVFNCVIRDFARLDRTYAPAVFVDGVGHHVVSCEISDSPHHGIRLEGDLHTVAYCEVFNVVHEFDDQGGIDMWGDPTYRGNRFFHNYWRDIANDYDVAGQAGIRLDDMIAGTFIHGNIFLRSAGGRFGAVQIHGGKDNIVSNNLFIDCQAAMSYSTWGERRYRETLARPDIQRKINAGTVPARMERFPSMADLLGNADRNFIVNNVAVNCPRFAMWDRGVNLNLGNNSFFGGLTELGFASEDDLTLKPDSTILRHTMFRPIPFEQIGIRRGYFRPE